MATPTAGMNGPFTLKSWRIIEIALLPPRLYDSLARAFHEARLRTARNQTLLMALEREGQVDLFWNGQRYVRTTEE